MKETTLTRKESRSTRKRVEGKEARQIIADYRSGTSVTEIARRSGRSVWTISRVLSKAGVRRRRTRVHLDPDEVRRLYESGKTLAQVAAALNTTASVVYSAMRRWQIPRRGRGRPAGRVISPERDRAMIGMRQAGATLQEIGDLFGLTRERVRQVLSDLKFSTPLAELRKNRRKRILQGVPFPSRQSLEYLMLHEGMSVNDLAQRLDISPATVKSWTVQMGIATGKTRKNRETPQG